MMGAGWANQQRNLVFTEPDERPLDPESVAKVFEWRRPAPRPAPDQVSRAATHALCAPVSRQASSPCSYPSDWATRR